MNSADQLKHFDCKSLSERFIKQNHHKWFVSQSLIERVISPPGDTYIYWRGVGVAEPCQEGESFTAWWCDGFYKALALGLYSNNVAVLVATEEHAIPFWLSPEDFIGIGGEALIKSAGPILWDENDACLRSAIVTSGQPFASSSSIGPRMHERMEAMQGWIYEGCNRSYIFWDR
jgi:hypothetical protein